MVNFSERPTAKKRSNLSTRAPSCGRFVWRNPLDFWRFQSQCWTNRRESSCQMVLGYSRIRYSSLPGWIHGRNRWNFVFSRSEKSRLLTVSWPFLKQLPIAFSHWHFSKMHLLAYFTFFKDSSRFWFYPGKNLFFKLFNRRIFFLKKDNRE